MITTHETYMQRAIELARLAEGQTSPNPLVGAVLVKDGIIIGEGYHHKAGLPHAEVEALRDAGSDAKGSTAYVTLEPCAHHGRTPPCSLALIEAGVAEVYYAVRDPNPRVDGRGHDLLEQAGITVHAGLCEADARAMNGSFLHWMETGKPLVTAKYGMTLDGKIATISGESKWITNEQSRLQAHKLRAISDVIMVGSGTVIADDPSLTTRHPAYEGQHPVRIVVDEAGITPLTAKLYQNELVGQTIVATTAMMSAEKESALVAQGVTVWRLPQRGQFVDLDALLLEIGRHNWLSVMVEGGSGLLGAFLAGNHINHVWAFIAPKLFGGQSAPSPIGGTGISAIANTIELSHVEITTFGSDVWVRGEIMKYE